MASCSGRRTTCIWGPLTVGSHMAGNGDKMFFWIMPSFPLEDGCFTFSFCVCYSMSKRRISSSNAYLLRLLLSILSLSNLTLCEVLTAKENSKF